MNTIVALSTPIGRSAVAVVRMSGADSIEIARKFFSPFPQSPNLLRVGNLQTANFVERAMCVYFVAPKSFTGENIVEFHCHGGVEVPKAVVQACLDNGAQLAQNGEFSKRAFVNGKMNLSNAEGMIEMIDAESSSAAKAGSNLLENRLGKITVEIQDSLTDLISQTEVALDYPEEDLELLTSAQAQQEIQRLIEQLDGLTATAQIGRMVKEGINIALTGKVNVGKSSLLNAILGQDRAIVSDIAGTTRDTLVESVSFKGVKFTFVDTAGIRESRDSIESEGVKRAQKAVENADLVLHIVDDINNTSTLETAKKVVKVFNKCDTFETNVALNANEIAISAKQNINIDGLLEKIYQMFDMGQIDGGDLILTNIRHIECLKSAAQLLAEALVDSKTSTLDCTAQRLRNAWSVLGEVTGTTADEQIIDRIYSKFCLGK